MIGLVHYQSSIILIYRVSVSYDSRYTPEEWLQRTQGVGFLAVSYKMDKALCVLRRNEVEIIMIYCLVLHPHRR
ncbi:hypothetical protein POPTR_010G161250v4 [Populus trichocarpa]|uniref:Uncharacterized protein n=1 Tax=Populus trichocarpa TaxID=3694 RepID=A0A3N7FMK9_POPTR|nr:hypothetical protein POPTR_010G161250v4 [Populus trichocarpa]